VERKFYAIHHESYFFDALYEMIRHKTNELVVLDGERFESL
jgi:signal-transduction protein with cAMP-binding, CBS, and nucleotidyltransferase domain